MITAERSFRIAHGQDHIHYVTDVCVGELFVVRHDTELQALLDRGEADPREGGDARRHPLHSQVR